VSRKSGPKFTKIGDDLLGCYAQMSLIVPNFIALSETIYDKSVTIFTPFSILAPQAQETPFVPKFTNLGDDVQQGPSTKLPNFVPF